MDKKSLTVQVGGTHYQGFKIQPVEFITKNELSFLQGCIIKRICRYNISGGKGIQDLNKIKHEIDLIIDLAINPSGEKTVKQIEEHQPALWPLWEDETKLEVSASDYTTNLLKDMT